MQKRRAGVIILCATVVLAFGSIERLHSNETKYHSSVTAYARLKHNVHHESHKLKHPVIRQTVPTAYKKMMNDGHEVAHAEQTLMRMSKQGHGQFTKADRKSNKYQTAENYLHQFVEPSTDNDTYTHPWTDHFMDSVTLMPGTSDAYGDYNCAFVMRNGNHHIDNIITATYDPTGRKFSQLLFHGSDNVFGQYMPKKPKKAKKAKKGKRTKKPVKKQAKGARAVKKNHGRGRVR